MDREEKQNEENFDFLYKDYLEAEKGDTDDLIFALFSQDKKQSEK